MDRLNTDILIIGENIHSVLLAKKLHRIGKKVILLTQNSAAQLINPVFKFYEKETPKNALQCLNDIQDFLAALGFSFKQDFSSFEALYSTDDIVKVLAMPSVNNYYNYARQNGKSLLFVHIENIKYLFNIRPRDGLRVYRSCINNKDKIYSIYECSALIEEDEQCLSDFIKLLKDSGCKEDEVLVLPPVLGTIKTEKILNKIKNQLNREVFEVLTPDAIISSIRVYLKLQEIERLEGLNILRARVKGFERDRGFIKKIITENFEIYPESIVLMTGRFVEEGLCIRENKVVEPIFDLPVFFESSENRIESFTSENIFDKQPFLRCGIRVDKDLRPVNESNEVIFENLYSCGTIVQNNYDLTSILFQTSELTGRL